MIKTLIQGTIFSVHTNQNNQWDWNCYHQQGVSGAEQEIIRQLKLERLHHPQLCLHFCVVRRTNFTTHLSPPLSRMISHPVTGDIFIQAFTVTRGEGVITGYNKLYFHSQTTVYSTETVTVNRSSDSRWVAPKVIKLIDISRLTFLELQKNNALDLNPPLSQLK